MNLVQGWILDVVCSLVFLNLSHSKSPRTARWAAYKHNKPLQVVQFKQQSRLEEKRKKALDLQLDFIVGQTEKYSDLLTQSLNETLPVPSKTSGSRAGSTASSPPPPAQLIEDGQFPQLLFL